MVVNRLPLSSELIIRATGTNDQRGSVTLNLWLTAELNRIKRFLLCKLTDCLYCDGGGN